MKILIDNFDFVCDNLMRFSEAEESFYTVYLIQSHKDNEIDPLERFSYQYWGLDIHLAMYYITSKEELLKYRDEIISKCESNNARAYITLNPRYMAEVKEQITYNKSVFKETDPRHIHAKEIASFNSCLYPNRFSGYLSLLNIDEGPVSKIQETEINVWDYIFTQINTFGIETMGGSFTPKGGVKLIIKPDNTLKYILFEKALKNVKHLNKEDLLYGAKIELDAPMILYSNVETQSY